MTANATARPHPSRRAHARSIFLERSRTRAPEREDGSAQPSSRLVAEPLPCRPISRCQTAHVFSFPHADARGLASVSPTQSRGGRSADRRIFLSLSRLSARVSRAGEARRVRCAWTAKRTLAFRRSTVAFVGRGPDFAGASAGKPAKAPAAARRTFRLRHCRRIRRSRASRGKRFEPPPQDATPRSAFRIVSGDAPR
jgi:hypothetical protein